MPIVGLLRLGATESERERRPGEEPWAALGSFFRGRVATSSAGATFTVRTNLAAVHFGYQGAPNAKRE
jgi:hypothetical protein